MRALFLPLFLIVMVALPVSVRAGELDRAMDATLIVKSADGHDRFLGSAFIWRDGTWAVTNAHVVGRAREVVLVSATGERRKVKVLARDAVRDVAILAVDGSFGPGLEPAAAPAGLGTQVYALGAPLGIEFTLTRGIISAMARQVEAAVPIRLVQHDAAVNPGSSGGPLVNAQGQLLGMNSQIADGSRHYIGVAYAISASDLARIVPQLIAGTLKEMPALGLQVRPIDEALAQALGVPAKGVLVDSVAEASPADRAGIRPGDVIVSVAGREVAAPGDVAFAVEAVLGSDGIAVQLLRAGETVLATMPLDRGEHIETAGIDRATLPTARPAFTFSRLGVRLSGAEVTHISENSPAYLAGLSRGDEVLAVNGKPLNEIDGGLAALRITEPMVLLVRHAEGRTEHIYLDPWDKTPRLRPVGGGNVLDPDVVVL
ncbi:S1C family serine protease [Oceanicola sp. 502str15]|uniref:S1C family serine protease n=1 Tax=Oceanicola sp. 502str15 TaxID=2696061 RepID=UPI002095FEF5|nr:trypsin-like peptidase domain-containing protein [Oceanicola sp. 502str15]MCO6381153.1 PDZ domain-containing protein [Oceanicola sp. 502str15]